jgi:hypothetical protein
MSIPQLRMCSIRSRDPTSLVVGVDADDVDYAHAFVEGVQRYRGEADRTLPMVATKTSRSPLCSSPHRVGVDGAPVELVQPEENRVA